MENLYEIYLQYPLICTDTRAITSNCLFFCLKGDNFDGNKFALKALDMGAAYVVTEDSALSANPRCIVVEDTLQALQQLAVMHRKHLNIPILGITGTNGKTTTKELVAAVLSQKYKVAFTQGNLNNHIGVPLTLLSIRKEDEIAVVEMGANHVGEIAALCEISQPDLGIITNIGTAHMEGFLSFENIVKTKKALYQYVMKNNGTLFVNLDDAVLTEKLNYDKIVGYGKADNNLVRSRIVEMNPFLSIEMFGNQVNTQLTGVYNFNNILCAATVGQFFAVDSSAICRALADYSPNNHRSQIIKTDKNEIIADYYNANPSSMKLALENLVAIQNPHKVAILGDMRELGTVSEEEHKKMISFCENAAIEAFFVGPEFYKLRGNSHYFFENTTALNQYLETHPIENCLLLMKGSRGIHLENVVI